MFVCSTRHTTPDTGLQFPYLDIRLHTICRKYLKIVCYINSIFVLLCEHTTPDSIFLLWAGSTQFLLQCILSTPILLRGVELVQMTAPKCRVWQFQQISLGVRKFIHTINITQTHFPQKQEVFWLCILWSPSTAPYTTMYALHAIRTTKVCSLIRVTKAAMQN